MRDALGRETEMIYNARGELVQTIHAKGTSEQTSESVQYDAEGRREFMQDGSTIDSKFDRGNGPGFAHDVAGTRDHDAVFGGGGGGMLWGENFTTSVYYNTTLGSHDYDQQSITLVAGWQF